MFGLQIALELNGELNGGSAAELVRIVDSEILPILRKQKGFRDETILIAPERAEAIASTFWDTKEDAEAYERAAYPAVLEALTRVINRPPIVKTFEFATATAREAAGVIA